MKQGERRSHQSLLNHACRLGRLVLLSAHSCMVCDNMTFYKRVTLFSIIGCQQMLIFFTTSMAWSEVHTLLVRHLNSLGICTSHSVFSLAKKHKEKKMFGVFSVIKVKWRDSKYYRACLIIDELTRLKPFCRLCVLLPSDCHRTNELCGWITAVMTKLQGILMNHRANTSLAAESLWQ